MVAANLATSSQRHHMTLLTDLETFVTDHRPHGELLASEGGLTPNGYRLAVSRPCGVTFER